VSRTRGYNFRFDEQFFIETGKDRDISAWPNSTVILRRSG
jgi:hypothetical protein